MSARNVAGSSDFTPAHDCADGGESATHLPGQAEPEHPADPTRNPAARSLPSAGTCPGTPLTPLEQAGLDAWMQETRARRHEAEASLALTDALGQALAAMTRLR